MRFFTLLGRLLTCAQDGMNSTGKLGDYSTRIVGAARQRFNFGAWGSHVAWCSCR
jgi:hypothetical protein